MKTKNRHNKKLRFLLLILIIDLLLFFFIFNGFDLLTASPTERNLKKLNYSNKAISLIIDNKLDKYLINNNLYSKTLEVALLEGQYEKNLLEEYVYFPYKDYDDYITQLNKLNDIGYERPDIEKVFAKLDPTEINTIIAKNYVINDLSAYLDSDYFNINNLDRYIDYQKENKSYNSNKVISYVNMYLDYPYYEHDINVTSTGDDLLIIANKYYKLGSSYVPKDLVKIDARDSYDKNTFQVVSIVKENFNKMNADMKKVGLGLLVKSGYRSYQTQIGLYNDYVKSHGKVQADTFSARAGYSEHQTGLAIDVCASKSCSYGTFESTEEYKWMKNNSSKYGFILRYPEDKTNITGYKFESWHFRYVGVDVAKYIYDNNLTFDEYYAMFIAPKKTE